jgi:hypothetical protein
VSFGNQLWRRPGAASIYLSVLLGLGCVGLSRLFQPNLEGWIWCIFSINLVLSILLFVSDGIRLCRNHCFAVLRLSAARSYSRLLELGVRSTQIDHFVNALWSDSNLEHRCSSTRFQLAASIVQALDGLSRTAARYGRCGKKIFEANQDSVLEGIQLFECLEFVDVEKAIVETLCVRLKSPPEFDPEGWIIDNRLHVRMRFRKRAN